MQEILVAIDGSKHSEKVVDLASRLAKDTSASVMLLYVVPQLSVPEEYADYAKVEGLDPSGYLDAVGRQILGEMGKRLEGSGVKHEGISAVGNASEKIVETARLRNAWLIVIGLQGLHGVGRVRALGSTARRVAENSPVPVLVVP